jgi:hypothetical protein
MEAKGRASGRRSILALLRSIPASWPSSRECSAGRRTISRLRRPNRWPKPNATRSPSSEVRVPHLPPYGLGSRPGILVVDCWQRCQWAQRGIPVDEPSGVEPLEQRSNRRGPDVDLGRRRAGPAGLGPAPGEDEVLRALSREGKEVSVREVAEQRGVDAPV